MYTVACALGSRLAERAEAVHNCQTEILALHLVIPLRIEVGAVGGGATCHPTAGKLGRHERQGEPLVFEERAGKSDVIGQQRIVVALQHHTAAAVCHSAHESQVTRQSHRGAAAERGLPSVVAQLARGIREVQIRQVGIDGPADAAVHIPSKIHIESRALGAAYIHIGAVERARGCIVLAFVKVFAPVAYDTAHLLDAVVETTVSERHVEVQPAGEVAIGDAEVVAALGIELSVALGDALRVEVIEVGVQIIDAGARQAHAIFEAQRLVGSYLEVDLHRGHQIGIVSAIIGVGTHSSREVAYVLVGVFVAQTGHEGDSRAVVSITEIGSQNVVAVLVVVAALVVVDKVADDNAGIVDVIGALVVAHDVFESGLYGVVFVYGRGIVGLEGVLYALVVGVGAVGIELQFLYYVRRRIVDNLIVLGVVLNPLWIGAYLV